MKRSLPLPYKELEQYPLGQTKHQGFFVGPVMKKTSDRADPKLTNQLCRTGGRASKGSFPGSTWEREGASGVLQYI